MHVKMSERINDEDGNVIIRCAGIVRRSEKILLVKSTYDGEPYWIFPGGGLEPGESLRECARREVQEETGLEVDVNQLVFINENSSDDESMIHFTYFCEPLSDKPVPGEDPDKEQTVIQDVAYFSPDEISELDNFLPQEMKRVLKTAIENDFKNCPKEF